MASSTEAMTQMARTFLGLLLICSAISADKSLLTQLYKKASQENRPLILVLDSNLNERSDVAEGPADKDILDTLVNDLDHLEFDSEIQRGENHEKRHHVQSASDKFYDDILQRLQLVRERVDKHDDRERDRDRDHRSHHDHKANGRDISEQRKQEIKFRYRPEKTQERNIGGSPNVHEISLFNDQSNKKQRRIRKKDSYLRSSVLKNLLRISNDLNCDAKDECEDSCGSKFKGKKKNSCSMNCEVKFDCQEEEESEMDCEDDECQSSEENPSTKGMPDASEEYTGCDRC